MPLEIKEYLQKLGLNEIEIDLYLALITIGPSTILELSRNTDIKRSTVHVNVESLIKKDFIKESKVKQRRVIIAEDPKKLEKILNDKLLKIEELKGNTSKMIRELFLLADGFANLALMKLLNFLASLKAI